MDNRKVALITGITGQDGSYLLSCYWKKVMMFTELSVDHQLISVSASLIWKVSQTFTFITPTSVTL